jgi:hypothetical protein
VNKIGACLIRNDLRHGDEGGGLDPRRAGIGRGSQRIESRHPSLRGKGMTEVGLPQQYGPQRIPGGLQAARSEFEREMGSI